MPIDYNRYPPDWPIRRARILTRAAHCCEHCEVPNYSIIHRHGEHHVVLRRCKDMKWARLWKQAFPSGKIVILTIAHLDHNEWDHTVTDDRLRALCQRCHLAYDRHDNRLRNKYGKYFRENQLTIV